MPRVRSVHSAASGGGASCTAPSQENQRLAEVFVRFSHSRDHGKRLADSFADTPPPDGPVVPSDVVRQGVKLSYFQAKNALAWLKAFATPEEMSAADERLMMKLWPQLCPRQDGMAYFPEFARVARGVSEGWSVPSSSPASEAASGASSVPANASALWDLADTAGGNDERADNTQPCLVEQLSVDVAGVPKVESFLTEREPGVLSGGTLASGGDVPRATAPSSPPAQGAGTPKASPHGKPFPQPARRVSLGSSSPPAPRYASTASKASKATGAGSFASPPHSGAEGPRSPSPPISPHSRLPRTATGATGTTEGFAASALVGSGTSFSHQPRSPHATPATSHITPRTPAGSMWAPASSLRYSPHVSGHDVTISALTQGTDERETGTEPTVVAPPSTHLAAPPSTHPSEASQAEVWKGKWLQMPQPGGPGPGAPGFPRTISNSTAPMSDLSGAVSTASQALPPTQHSSGIPSRIPSHPPSSQAPPSAPASKVMLPRSANTLLQVSSVMPSTSTPQGKALSAPPSKSGEEGSPKRPASMCFPLRSPENSKRSAVVGHPHPAGWGEATLGEALMSPHGVGALLSTTSGYAASELDPPMASRGGVESPVQSMMKERLSDSKGMLSHSGLTSLLQRDHVQPDPSVPPQQPPSTAPWSPSQQHVQSMKKERLSDSKGMLSHSALTSLLQRDHVQPDPSVPPQQPPSTAPWSPSQPDQHPLSLALSAATASAAPHSDHRGRLMQAISESEAELTRMKAEALSMYSTAGPPHHRSYATPRAPPQTPIGTYVRSAEEGLTDASQPPPSQPAPFQPAASAVSEREIPRMPGPALPRTAKSPGPSAAEPAGAHNVAYIIIDRNDPGAPVWDASRRHTTPPGRSTPPEPRTAPAPAAVPRAPPPTTPRAPRPAAYEREGPPQKFISPTRIPAHRPTEVQARHALQRPIEIDMRSITGRPEVLTFSLSDACPVSLSAHSNRGVVACPPPGVLPMPAPQCLMPVPAAGFCRPSMPPVAYQPQCIRHA